MQLKIDRAQSRARRKEQKEHFLHEPIGRPQPSGFFGAILPKTLAGVAVWLLLIGIGMGASGVGFFAFYQYRLGELEAKIDGFSAQFDEEFQKRSQEFSELVRNSKAELERSSVGASRQASVAEGLLTKVSPSIGYVRGKDAAGAATSGSGFAVTSNGTETWVVTSYRLVAGAAPTKAPVQVKLGDKDLQGEVWSWDERRDLALIIIKTGNLPVLEWEEGEAGIGEKVWAVGSSPGKFKAAAAEGAVLDSAPDGLLIDADVATSSIGGPLVSRQGKIFGVLTSNYAPEGFTASSDWAVPIRLACQKIIKCP